MEILLGAGDNGQEVNAKKTKHMLMSSPECRTNME
jgi:hypothetical protein